MNYRYLLCVTVMLMSQAALGMQALIAKQKEVANRPLSADEKIALAEAQFKAVYPELVAEIKKVGAAELEVARNAYQNPDAVITQLNVQTLKEAAFKFSQEKLENVNCQTMGERSGKDLCLSIKKARNVATMFNLKEIQELIKQEKKQLYAQERNTVFEGTISADKLKEISNKIYTQIQGKPSAKKAKEYLDSLVGTLSLLKMREYNDLMADINGIENKQSWRDNPGIQTYAAHCLQSGKIAFDIWQGKNVDLKQFKESYKLWDVLHRIGASSDPNSEIIVAAIDKVYQQEVVDIKLTESDVLAKLKAMLNLVANDDALMEQIEKIKESDLTKYSIRPEDVKQQAITYVNNVLKACKQTFHNEAVQALNPVIDTSRDFAERFKGRKRDKEMARIVEELKKGEEQEKKRKEVVQKINEKIVNVASGHAAMMKRAWNGNPRDAESDKKLENLRNSLPNEIKQLLVTLRALFTGYDSEYSYNRFLEDNEIRDLIRVTNNGEAQETQELKEKIKYQYNEILMRNLPEEFQKTLANNNIHMAGKLRSLIESMLTYLRDLPVSNIAKAQDPERAYQYAKDWVECIRSKAQEYIEEAGYNAFNPWDGVPGLEYALTMRAKLFDGAIAKKRAEQSESSSSSSQQSGAKSQPGGGAKSQQSGGPKPQQSSGAQGGSSSQQSPLDPRSKEIRDALFPSYTGSITGEYLVKNWSAIQKNYRTKALAWKDDEPRLKALNSYNDEITKAKDDAETSKLGISVTVDKILANTPAQMYELFGLNEKMNDDTLRTQKDAIDVKASGLRNHIEQYHRDPNGNKALAKLDCFKDFIDARIAKPLKNVTHDDFLIRKINGLIGRYTDTASKVGLDTRGLNAEQKQNLEAAREKQDALRFEIDLLRAYITKTYPTKAQEISKI